jgi:hypothetical protein
MDRMPTGNESIEGGWEQQQQQSAAAVVHHGAGYNLIQNIID